MTRLKRFILTVTATISLVLMPVAANAAYQVLTCENDGSATPGTSLFDADTKDDPINHTGVCQYSNEPAVEHVFSLIICDFVVILNAIMDKMYCGINFYMYNVISVILTLYVTIYGAQILMGTAQVSTRDGVVRLLKLSFIFVFATRSAYSIGYIFRFFMAFINDASTAVLNVLSSQMGAKNDGVCSFAGLDGQISTMYSFLDYLVCHSLIGPASNANTKVQGLFLAMIIALPPMTLLFQWWLMTTVKALVRTLVSFLKAIAAIAFLVTLAPMFLGFFLFQTTTYLFENWLRYMIAFSVQVIMVLAIIVFWIMTIDQFIDFFNELSNVIFPFKPAQTVGGIYKPSNGWAICPADYTTSGTNNEPKALCKFSNNRAQPPDNDGYTTMKKCVQGAAHPFDANPPKCKAIYCIDPSYNYNLPDYDTTFPVCPGNWLTATGTMHCEKVEGDIHLYECTLCTPPNNPHWMCDNQDLLPTEKIINQGDFLYYVFYHIFTLLLISYCFSILLEKADDIARSLAGPSGVPSLTPGFGAGLGNASAFKRPKSTSGKPTDETPTEKMSAGFDELVNKRD